MNQHPGKKSVPPSVGADVSGIETLLNRNLPEVFGEGDPARRRAAIQQLYTEDCVLYVPPGTFVGHDALVSFIKLWREKLHGASLKHWNNNLQITGNGKEANGFVYLMLVDVTTKPASMVSTHTYTDNLVKTKDGWRFTKRITKADVPPAAAAAAAPAATGTPTK